MIVPMLRFELKYHFRQIIFKITAIVFFCLGMLAVQGSFGSDEVHKNSPYVVTTIISILSLASIFASTLFCASVVLRDTTYKMDAVVFTTSVKKLPYFIVRFLGLTLAVFFIMVFCTLGVFTGMILVDSSRLGSFNIVYFLQPLFVFGFLNVLFSGTLIFCTALLTRSVRAIYVVGVLLYILYWVASILGNSPLLATSALKIGEPDIWPLLSDPFGLSSFYGDTRGWTDLQRNTQVFPLKGTFLMNRLLWICFTALLLTVTYRFFNFRLNRQVKKKQQKQQQKSIPVIPFKHHDVRPYGYQYNLITFLSQLKLEVIALFKHIPFMVMLLLWIFVFGIDLKDTLFSGSYGIHSYPATGIIIEQMRSMRFAMVLIIFFAAEVLGRERAANMQALIYTTPVKNVVLWGAKCLTLLLLAMILITANIGIGIVTQVSHGYFKLELLNYLSLYYYSGAPFLLYVILAVFIQNLTPNKYLGMLLNMLMAFMIIFSRRLGIEHYLLRFASVPELQHSYMNGFGHYAKAFNWYILYWAGFAAMIAIVTIGMWQNSQQSSWRHRLKSVGGQIKSNRFLFAAGAIFWITTGAYIYYQTNITGKYMNSAAQLEWRTRYEQKFKSQAMLPQPVIKSVNTAVDLYPESAKYRVKGNYRLKNESDKPISTIWVSINPEVSSFNISVPGTAKQRIDTGFNQQWITLKTPLRPGGELTMQFSIEVFTSGFMPFNTENSIVSNGSYIELEKYVPQFGYNSGLETDDLLARKKTGLPEKSIISPSDSTHHLIDLETTVSTAADQYVVTVGALQKTWLAQDRRYFHYKTSVPISFMFALSSARYAVKKENYKGVELSICYQPGQEYNIKTMMQAVKDAMDYGNASFSPYPLKYFTLAQIPQYRGAATAYPGLMFSAENINFLGNYSDSGKVDQSYAIAAHEVAHQWWANKLNPNNGAGAASLTESLAKYTEAMVAEKRFGKMYLRDYLKMDNNLYFSMRNRNGEELPLAQTIDQPFVYYQKGGLVMYALKETLGEKQVNDALQHLIQEHAAPGIKARPADLIRELSRQATPTQLKFINDCFNQVVTYKMKLQVLSCKPLPNGQFNLNLAIYADQVQQGAKQLLPPDMDIDLAVFDQQKENLDRNSKPVYLKKYHFNKQETLLTLVVNHKPKTVVIDPYAYLLDDDLGDNMQEIK